MHKPLQKASLLVIAGLALPVAAILGGCRGEISTRPPVHIVPNMDWQDKLKAQSESHFPGWKDKRGMRLPVAHTVPAGRRAALIQPPSQYTTPWWNASSALGRHDPEPAVARLYAYGKVALDKQTGEPTGKQEAPYLSDNPLPATRETLERGRQRFNIHCAVCHGSNGRGVGIVGRRLATPPPSFVPKASDDHRKTRNQDWDRIVKMPDGEIFGVITDGKSTMLSYAGQVPVRDRWAIVHYIRALQYRATH